MFFVIFTPAFFDFSGFLFEFERNQEQLKSLPEETETRELAKIGSTGDHLNFFKVTLKIHL